MRPGELSSCQGSSEHGVWKPNEQLAPAGLDADAAMGTALAVQENLQLENLSRCIEDIHKNFLQYFKTENFDQFAIYRSPKSKLDRFTVVSLNECSKDPIRVGLSYFFNDSRYSFGYG